MTQTRVPLSQIRDDQTREREQGRAAWETLAQLNQENETTYGDLRIAQNRIDI